MARDPRPEEIPSPPSAVESDAAPGDVSRRSFLRWSAVAGAGATLGGIGAARPAGALEFDKAGDRLDDVKDATIVELQQAMAEGQLTALGLTRRYLNRIQVIDREVIGLNSILEVNPDAEAIARALDQERRAGNVRGPLHGIPVVLKDNIDTGDRMGTRAGSLALVGAPAPQDSTVAARLRAAGAVILGKAGLSEWANFRGFSSSSGWSGVGGQVRNPYVLDRNPCGSSSGSAASVSASLCAAALGTETDGSIVCPSSANGVVGIKPTVGLTSRAGVVPIAAAQDTVGPHGRTVADAAAVLGALTGVDPRDSATAASAGNSFTDYTQFLDPNGLAGARIGVDLRLTGDSANTDAVFFAALDAMTNAGAEIVQIEIPSLDEFFNDISEIVVLVYEFKRDLNAYLATRTGVPVSSMADCIAFNLAHFDEELKYFGQEWMELAEAEIFSEADYMTALETGPRLAGEEGIDAALAADNLDTIAAPTNSPAWPNDLVNGDCFVLGTSGFAAVAGYPLVTVPAGYSYGLPVGMTFMGPRWGEPGLIRLASGFEATLQARQSPEYLPSMPPELAPKARRHRGHVLNRADRLLRSSVPRPRYL